MKKKGHFSTRRKAENHAANLRRNFPKMKSIRVVKVDDRWDVIASN